MLLVIAVTVAVLVVAFGVLVFRDSGWCVYVSSNNMIPPVSSSLSKGIVVLVVGSDAFGGVLKLSLTPVTVSLAAVVAAAAAVPIPTPRSLLLFLSLLSVPVHSEAWDSKTCQAIED